MGLAPYDPSRALPVPAMPAGMLDHRVPQPAGPVSVTWTAVVTANRDYYARIQAVNDAEADAIAFPGDIPERRFPLAGGELLIGRRSDSRNIYPDIDLIGPPRDPGVHRASVPLRAGDSIHLGAWTKITITRG